MPAYRHKEENSLAAMLTINRSAGITPEVNVRECVTCTPPPSVNMAAHSGHEIHSRCHQTSKKRVISGPTKRIYVLQYIFFKKIALNDNVHMTEL